MLPRLSCRLNMLIIAGIIGYKQPQLVVDEMLQFLDLEEHCSKKFGSCR
ncbi:hypothetical protein OESDEN_02744 [Oesophagostomum dentatum]|uniref:Uncharacterized protein n=1 Tax=Oesophagostomum dentatum TaxID=61180 RepID=A0A0B1TN72_OESDE|nr:hypothetical protein OESDEN_02744 [Oesophagostomum dentatum]